MLKFIAERRFNYVDVFGNGAALIALWGGNYLSALTIIIVAAIASFYVERSAGAQS